jgi:hypothetical protein
MAARTPPLLVAAALLAALGAAPAARAEDPQPAPPSRLTAQEHRAPFHHVLVDALVVRPLALPATALLGGGFWLLGAPLFALAGDLDWWTDACLTEPVRQHLERPLGQL